MSVSLRVVGIFYVLDGIPFSQGMTVKDVLDYAVSQPGSEASKFGYLSNADGLTTGGDSVTGFAARYPKGVTSVTSGTKYSAGDYFLSESLVAPPRYSVWQYYVNDQNGTFKPNPQPLQSFSTRQIDDGDKITWRLVEVLSGPSEVPTVYQAKLLGGGGFQRAYAYVDQAGHLESGSGIADVQKIATGVFKVIFAKPYTDIPSVVATQQYNTGSPTAPGNPLDNAVVVSVTTTDCVIVTGNVLPASPFSEPTDRNFSVIVNGV